MADTQIIRQGFVVSRGDTLSVEASHLVVGGATSGAKSFVLSNLAGSLVLAANPTANRTQSLPDADGTIALASQLGPAAISAGTASVGGGTVVFSNSNSVTFGLSGSTITASISAGGAVRVSAWDNKCWPAASSERVSVFSTAGAIFRTQFFASLSATRMDFNAIGQNASTYSYTVGIYTMNGSTASMASSLTISASLANTIQSVLSATCAWNITPGDYLFGFWGSGAGGNAGYVGARLTTPAYTAAQNFFRDGLVKLANSTQSGSFEVSQQLVSSNGASVAGMVGIVLVGSF